MGNNDITNPEEKFFEDKNYKVFKPGQIIKKINEYKNKGYEVTGFHVKQQDEILYEIFTLKNKTGKGIKLYFDITDLFNLH